MNVLNKVFCLIIFLSAFLFQACDQKVEAKREEKTEVPELLKRQAVIGSNQEIDYILNTYDKLKTTIEANPNDFNARLQLAELYMIEARLTGEHPYYYPAAIDMINSILEKDPQDQDIKFSALSLKASVLLSLHKFEEAKKVAEQAVAISQNNAQIYGALVDANVELGNYDEAVKMSDKMISLRPDLRSYSRISYLRELHGEVDGAIEAMKMAVSAGYPGYEETSWSRVTLGNLYENYGDLPNAEVQYRLALKEREEYPFAIAALAGLEIKKGNYAEAEKLLNHAIKLIPEVGFYEQLADIYMKTDRKEKAQETIKDVIEMMKEDEASGHVMDLEMAKVYMEYQQDLGKALKHAMKEYKARPDNIQVNEMLARIYFKKGNIQKANKHLETALRTSFKDPSAYCLAGLIAIKNGNEEKGKELIRKSFEMNPYLDGELAMEAKAYINNTKAG